MSTATAPPVRTLPVSLIVHRLEVAAEAVPLTIAQWGHLLAILLPSEFGRVRFRRATDALPTSPRKVRIMGRRFELQVPLFHPGDVGCDGLPPWRDW